MRYTQKRRDFEKLLNIAIEHECETVYGKEVALDVKNISIIGENWVITSKTHYYYDDSPRTGVNCYYFGKKPTLKDIGSTEKGRYLLRCGACEFVKVSKKHLDALKNIKYESLQTVKALQEWKEAMDSKEQKQKACRQKVKELQLDFDGQISTEEINKLYPHLYTKFSKTRISWHKMAGIYHYKSKPEFFIYIKPVSDGIYNKKEFETKMNNVKTA